MKVYNVSVVYDGGRGSPERRGDDSWLLLDFKKSWGEGRHGCVALIVLMFKVK
jgi:hypothetical protein